MKQFISLIALMAITIGAQAQFVTGPRQQHAVSSLPFTMAAFAPAAGSNISTRVPFRVGASGNVGFYVNSVNTNANSTTMQFLFQISQDGDTWMTPQFPASVVITGNGTTPVTLFTNKWSSDQLKNVNWIRLSTITNGHTASTIYSNLTFFQH